MLLRMEWEFCNSVCFTAILPAMLFFLFFSNSPTFKLSVHVNLYNSVCFITKAFLAACLFFVSNPPTHVLLKIVFSVIENYVTLEKQKTKLRKMVKRR